MDPRPDLGPKGVWVRPCLDPGKVESWVRVRIQWGWVDVRAQRVWARWHLRWLGPGLGPDKGPKKSGS